MDEQKKSIERLGSPVATDDSFPRKAWKTPVIILGTLSESAMTGSATVDGGTNS